MDLQRVIFTSKYMKCKKNAIYNQLQNYTVFCHGHIFKRQPFKHVTNKYFITTFSSHMRDAQLN